jgi:uncharacterized protein with HEPN domain
MSRGDLDSDRIRFLAILRLVEIAGDAASRVSESTRSVHPGIPWHELIGTRNRLVHGYDVVDDESSSVVDSPGRAHPL